MTRRNVGWCGGLAAAVLVSATISATRAGTEGATGAPAVAATLAASHATQGKPLQGYSSGPYLYRTFCASCHGDAGRGDGPVASLLRVPAPDLTTIRARHGGTFPRAQMMAIVDGRTLVAGHGRREMPIWGDVLRVTEGQDERTIATRIEVLVTYLESLQAGAAR